MLKVGMVGLDTSHCIAFTRILNDEAHEFHVPGARVIAAYPGGSAEFSLSRERVRGFTAELEEQFGLRLYESIEDLVRAVDAVLLESVDGRQHLEQFRRLAVGKPVFIDKPLACSTVDAREILRLAERTQTPCMSCSALRYAAGISDLLKPGAQVVSAEAFGPSPILGDYPGLFWYGVHVAEILFTWMGEGCRHVRCASTVGADVALGVWEDGRVGVFRGMRVGSDDFGGVVHTPDAVHYGVARSVPPYYALLLRQVVSFFETGVSPVRATEMFNVVAFLEAAENSKQQDGREVNLSVF